MPSFESIHLELRDFFRSISLDEVATLAQSIAESGREPELDATLRESSAAIPMVRQINAQINDRDAAGDHDNKRALQGQLLLLMAIFRLAEDKGYRWDPPAQGATQPQQ
jgi:hypothetical protein